MKPKNRFYDIFCTNQSFTTLVCAQFYLGNGNVANWCT